MKRKREIVLERWDNFCEKTLEELSRRRPLKRNLEPYERADQFLMRSVYRFVRSYRRRYPDDSGFVSLLAAMKGSREKDVVADRWNLTNVDMTRNPFHGVLFGLRDPVVDEGGHPELERTAAWATAQALLYADRHNVPERYLIGFIHQIGGKRSAAKKAKDPSQFEVWHHQRRSRRRG